MALRDEILTLKNKEGTLANNKVCNFAYDDTAFEDDTTAGANGVITYNYNNHNNIPVKDPAVLKTNATIIAKGFRSQVSVLPRMLLNHIFGRVSYNLNKTVDTFNSLLSNLYNYIGQPNGLATLDNTGRLPYSQLPLSAIEYKGAWNASTNTPTLASGTGTFGDEYIVSTQGTQNLGEGSITYRVGDRVIYNGSIWQRIPASSVRTVNSKTPDANGNVTVNASDMVTPNVYGYNKTNYGKAWSKIQEGNFTDGCYANGLWTVGGYSNSMGVWWSDDNGLTWNQCTGSIASVAVRGVYYANDLWLAYTYSDGMWWSEDGKTWTQCTGITSGAPMCKPRYANGLWVAGGGRDNTTSTEYGMWWSTDGKTWSQSLDPNSVNYSFTCVDYASGLWVAGCNSYYTGYAGIWWSTDGKTWTRVNVSGFSSGVTYVHYANDIWIAGGDKLSSSSYVGLWWSENGKDWTQCTGNFYMRITALHYANGLWLAGGSDVDSQSHVTYGMCWSKDGKVWEKGTGNFDDEVAGIDYAQGVFVAGGSVASHFSNDGKNWSYGGGYGKPHNDNGKWFLFGGRGIWTSTGTMTNNIAQILDWLLFAVDNMIN